jgi:hypothetical protein
MLSFAIWQYNLSARGDLTDFPIARKFQNMEEKKMLKTREKLHARTKR